MAYAVGEWTIQDSGTTSLLAGVDAVGTGEAWAVGENGTILHLTGGVWQSQPSGTSFNLNAVQMLSPTNGWAVGAGGTILHWDGSAWSPQSSGLGDFDLQSVMMLGPTEGWAFGGFGAAVKFNGTSWESLSTGVTERFWCIDMLSSTQGWVGSDKNVYAFDGSSLSAGPWGGGTLYFEGVDAVGASDVWVVGRSAGDSYYVYHYDGAAWSRVPTPRPPSVADGLWGLSMVDASDGWAVGSSGVILHYSQGAWTVHQQTVGPSWPISQDLWEVDMLSADEGWAVGANGTILHYTDSPGPPPAGTGSVSVSAQAPAPVPALSFAITPGIAPEGGTATASSIDFATLSHEVPKTGTQRLTVSTNAQGGYSVTGAEDHALRNGTYTIADVPGDGGGITELLLGIVGAYLEPRLRLRAFQRERYGCRVHQRLQAVRRRLGIRGRATGDGGHWYEDGKCGGRHLQGQHRAGSGPRHVHEHAHVRVHRQLLEGGVR